MQLGNTVKQTTSRISTLHSLTFLHAFEGQLYAGMAQTDLRGAPVVLTVSWLETPGVSGTSSSELWKPIQHNMWLATSQKK